MSWTHHKGGDYIGVGMLLQVQVRKSNTIQKIQFEQYIHEFDGLSDTTQAVRQFVISQRCVKARDMKKARILESLRSYTFEHPLPQKISPDSKSSLFKLLGLFWHILITVNL